MHQIKNLSYSIGDYPLLWGINWSIPPGKRAALIGANGAGKTTLTKLVAGELKPQQGSIHLGKRTAIGYYAQHRTSALNLEKTVLDEVTSSAATDHLPKIREILGIFKFRGDDVGKKIKVLSGGEKARVSLAKILLSPFNFLIMDEPTNHLDINSREALEQALMRYEGTVLLISHDRYFLDKVVNRVIEIRNGELRDYPGNYSYYLEKKKKHSASTSPSQKSLPSSGRKKRKQQKRQEAEIRQCVSKKRNQLNQEIENLEKKIDGLEKEKSEIEQKMTHPQTYEDGKLIVSLQKKHAYLINQLENLYQQWEKAKLELEDILHHLP